VFDAPLSGCGAADALLIAQRSGLAALPLEVSRNEHDSISFCRCVYYSYNSREGRHEYYSTESEREEYSSASSEDDEGGDDGYWPPRKPSAGPAPEEAKEKADAPRNTSKRKGSSKRTRGQDGLFVRDTDRASPAAGGGNVYERRYLSFPSTRGSPSSLEGERPGSDGSARGVQSAFMRSLLGSLQPEEDGHEGADGRKASRVGEKYQAQIPPLLTALTAPQLRLAADTAGIVLTEQAYREAEHMEAVEKVKEGSVPPDEAREAAVCNEQAGYRGGDWRHLLQDLRGSGSRLLSRPGDPCDPPPSDARDTRMHSRFSFNGLRRWRREKAAREARAADKAASKNPHIRSVKRAGYDSDAQSCDSDALERHMLGGCLRGERARRALKEEEDEGDEEEDEDEEDEDKKGDEKEEEDKKEDEDEGGGEEEDEEGCVPEHVLFFQATRQSSLVQQRR